MACTLVQREPYAGHASFDSCAIVYHFQLCCGCGGRWVHTADDSCCRRRWALRIESWLFPLLDHPLIVSPQALRHHLEMNILFRGQWDRILMYAKPLTIQRPGSSGRYQPRRGSTASSIHSIGGTLDTASHWHGLNESGQNGKNVV